VELKNKTKFFKILVVTISLVVTLWYGELTIRSNQSVDITQSSQVIQVENENLNDDIEIDKGLEIGTQKEIDKEIKIEDEKEIDKDTKAQIYKSEAKDLVHVVNNDEKIELEKGLPGTNLNKYVLNIISTYPTGTNEYPYLLNKDYANYNGVTENIYYKGDILAKGHPSGVKYSHCSGITFEVFFKAMQARNKALGISSDNFNNMNKDQLFDFLLTWYAATGPKSQSNIEVAVEKYGLGKKIKNLEDAIRGDFIDISRTNNTGHTMVFISWIKEGDSIVGIRYWSSQQSTNGIDYNEEYFNVKRSNGKVGNVIKDRVYIARVF